MVRYERDPYSFGEDTRGRGRSLTGAARLALGRMRALAEEARPSAPCASTASALFAIADMARANAFPNAGVTGFLRLELCRFWDRLARERARYTEGHAPELDETREPGIPLLSANAAHALRLARLLGSNDERARPTTLEHLLLGLLLCAPAPGAPVAAHALLARLGGLSPVTLLLDWHRFSAGASAM